jgi:hypothetical protein
VVSIHFLLFFKKKAFVLKTRLLAILFFFVLLVPLTGSFLWIQLKKHIIKEEVKQILVSQKHEKQLVWLKFSIAESETILKWEHSKEFEFDGNMYDIVDVTVTNDSVFYLCYHDRKETELNKKIDAIVAGIFSKEKETQQHQNLKISFYKSLFFSNFETLIKIPIFLFEKKYGCISKSYSSFCSSPIFPPPEFF